MSLRITVQKYTLHFKFDARTSRGAMQQHQVYYFQLYDEARPEVVGWGECAPLPGLSPEYGPDFDAWLQQFRHQFNQLNLEPAALNIPELVITFALEKWPSVRFGLETAALDWQQGGRKQLFDNYFSHSKAGIPINGLIWMGDQAFMQQQIEPKLRAGYSCLKLKIGGLDFATELSILRQIRVVAPANELTIRVDANGAFTPDNALPKLEQLAVYDIHSIEQPIKPNQPAEMARLCAQSPVPVALDEELIGITELSRKAALLTHLKPAYIILKPTLVGGFTATREWINLAETQGISWWMTSALESNIGLNAISQFTAEYTPTVEQGLGTGQLYHNNIPSPLQIESGKLFYNQNLSWGELLPG